MLSSSRRPSARPRWHAGAAGPAIPRSLRISQSSLAASTVATGEARGADPAVAASVGVSVAATARSHFVDTQKYGEVPARKGHARGQFGIFVDPVHCKGCAECVEVCAALGHDALIMIDKVTEEPATGESTLDRYDRDMRFFRSLPPTPPAYRNDKALADLMLGEHAMGYVGGAGSCAGCGEATAIRMLVAATRQLHGPESMGIVAATGCNTVYGSTYPFNPYRVPWTNSLFENAPAVALGVRARWDASGHPERRLWVLGGDGAMYDIGFQSLSRMVASGSDIKVLVLDTQVYSNTGGQASTASFGGQVTKLSAFGKALHGRPERRKELARILMAHGEVYVAQTSPAHINHFYRSIIEANEYPGPAVIVAYTPCQPEHGIGDDASTRQAKLAVDSRAFPLFTYDPRRGESMAERLSLQGNPAIRDDWSRSPDGSAVDFLAFARTEGRFRQHFPADGSVTPEIQATQDDRLAYWHSLQELAGIR
ncbi:MAG: thiamine pyrophosphate-binding protein [Chloroflexi bacterium]|nr:thiamine pyrophosphate-binding protein [Chloroflexota bacterium]